MSQLIQELRGQHQWLVQQLTAIQADPKQVPETLRSVRKALVAHLGKEDKQLYPVLQAVGDVDPKMKQIYNHFSGEMAQISQDALKFIEKYSGKQPKLGAEFQNDLTALMNVLGERISAEENVLYPAYERASDEQSSGQAANPEASKQASGFSPTAAMIGVGAAIAGALVMYFVLK